MAMRICPKCGESNGPHATKCYKCGYSFGTSPKYKKRCPKCKAIFNGNIDICPDCQTRTQVFDADNYSSAGYSSQPSFAWAYVLTIFVPLAGLIMGATMAGSREPDRASTGKALIFVSLAVGFIYGIIAAIAIT